MTNYVFQKVAIETLKYNDAFSVLHKNEYRNRVMRFVKVEKGYRGTNVITANHSKLGQITFTYNPHALVKKVVWLPPQPAGCANSTPRREVNHNSITSIGASAWQSYPQAEKVIHRRARARYPQGVDNMLR